MPQIEYCTMQLRNVLFIDYHIDIDHKKASDYNFLLRYCLN